MVAFTCNQCGASVKKAAVEKHYFSQCRVSKVVDVTCIDCLQDFNGSTYAAHFKCLTENEKYGAKGTVERSNNKGEVKQQDWLSSIQNVYETQELDFKHKQILEHIMNFDNIPRKKKPFMNFMKSSARMLSKNEAVIECLYDILDKAHKSRTPVNNNNNNKLKVESEPENDKLITFDETESHDSGVVSEKKKKKKNKHRHQSRESESSVTNEEAETSQTENELSENCPPTTEESPSEKTHLSKKEKKEKKKRNKYLTELNEIEKYEKPEENGVENEEPGKKKKEKKNRHKSESEVEVASAKTQVDENNAEEASPPAPLERKLSKKEKKRKISENASLEGEAKKKHKNYKGGEDVQLKENQKNVGEEESEEFIKPDKFKIVQVVRTVIQAAGGEIALKRLAKRVTTEYQIRCGVQDSDYIMAKFQKKIFNIPGVKIIKDKAVFQ